MKRFVPLLLALVVLAAPAVAGDDDEKKDPLKLQAKTSIKVFRKEFRSRDLGRRMNALMDLARVKHDLVIDELGKKPLYDRNPEVRDAVAQLLGEMDNNPEKAGEYLKEALVKNEDFPEVQRSIIRSIGNLKYKDAFEELKEAASHLNEEKYRWVTVEVVRAFGKIEDPNCLPFLLWMSEYGGKVLKWATGEVKVDKTRAGDADQREAEAKWKAKYGHIKPKKPPAPLIRTYMQELRKTVKKLTGQTFEDATEFRKWLEEHAKELGLDPDELSKDA